MITFDYAKIYSINGHRWRDVTHETSTSGDVYELRDVIACGGKRPWIASSDYEPKPQKEGDE